MKHSIQLTIRALVLSMLIAMPFAAQATGYEGYTTAVTSGYGGGCTIDVKPPAGGFSMSATPIPRNWWDWWTAPKVSLSINGGNASFMKISDYSDFSSAYFGKYQTGMQWNVWHPEWQGTKKVYAKFYSYCGKPTSPISASYYYWGW